MEKATRVVQRIDAGGRGGKDEEAVEDRRPYANVIPDSRQYEDAVLSRPNTIDLYVDQIRIVVRYIEATDECTEDV